MMSHRLSALSGRSDLEIIDIDGQKTAFTTSSRDMILGIGWMFYILGNISNIIFLELNIQDINDYINNKLNMF